jgi:two-component SAPR family response regulator
MIRDIIIIDDEVDMAKLISVGLDRLAIPNKYYVDPKLALEELLASKEMPDGIFLDILMPTLSGYDFLVTLYEDERFHSVPVILITAAKKLPPYATEQFEKYPIALVQKPINISSMLTIMAELRSRTHRS